MAVICPTVTTSTPHDFRDQMETAVGFAKRIHLDFADGVFAPTRLVPPEQAWWPDGIIADLHVMFLRPKEQLETLVALKPDLVIIHAEAEDIDYCLPELQAFGLKTGIALLPDTTVESVKTLLASVNHVLIFGGRLGYQGSDADLGQLDKIRQLKQEFPHLELGWDGGVNDQNIKTIVEAGVQVVNVGGFIQKSSDPKEAYATLEQIITGVKTV